MAYSFNAGKGRLENNIGSIPVLLWAHWSATGATPHDPPELPGSRTRGNETRGASCPQCMSKAIPIAQRPKRVVKAVHSPAPHLTDY